MALLISHTTRLSVLCLLCFVASVFGTLKSSNHHAFVIIGAGPAGVQWGLLLRDAGIEDYVILERNMDAGSFFQQYPRARHLISANRRNMRPERTAEFGLRHDWHSLLEAASFPGSRFSDKYYPDADELVTYLQSVSVGLNIKFNTTVEKTAYDKTTQEHEIVTSNGSIFAKRLIVATGMRMRETPECLQKAADEFNVTLHSYETYPNIETTDEEFCKGKQVTVFGSGNAAFETAEVLAPCASTIKLIYKNKPRFSFMTHYVGDVRILNSGIMDRYKLKSLDDVTAFWDVCEANPQSQYINAIRRAQNRSELRHDLKAPVSRCTECNVYRLRLRGQRNHAAVFAGGFTGMREGIVDLAEERQRFPVTGSFWTDQESPRRYFAGNLMHGADYRRSAGGFIHGFRYNIRAQFRHVMREYSGTPWPTRHFPDVTSAFLHAIEQFQNSSAMYQMSDFMVDAISVNDDGSATYWYELPEPWVGVEAPAVKKRGFQMHLEFSDKEAWDFDLNFAASRISRLPGLHLHPVITPVFDGELLERCNMAEDGLGAWVGDWNTAEMHFVLLLCAERLRAAERGEATATMDLEARVLQRMDEGAYGCAPRNPKHAPTETCNNYFYMHPPPVVTALE